MKLQLKSYLGETFMLFPNINLWTDDDPEYAPHKYQLFIGWLFWGIRIFFGKAGEEVTTSTTPTHFTVYPIHNTFLGKTMYVGSQDKATCISRFMIEVKYNIGTYKKGVLEFTSNHPLNLTVEERKALLAAEEIRDCNINYFPVLAWEDDRQCAIVCQLINRAAEAQKTNRWHFQNLPTPTHVLS